MIPPLIVSASEGWRTHSVVQGSRLLRITLGRDDLSIYIWRDRWRHTTARAYRGNALSAILVGQRAVADYLRGAS